MRWGCSTGGNDQFFGLLCKTTCIGKTVCYRQRLIPKLVVYTNPLINTFLRPSINAFSVCLHSVISNINCCKLDSGRLFKGFYSSILNVNVWLLHRRCNLLWISCIQASWRGFISMLMPRGRIFALLPACYYSAVHFMLLSVTLQQGAHH